MSNVRFVSRKSLWAAVLGLLVGGLTCIDASICRAKDDETEDQRWVRRTLDSYVPSMGGAVESIGTATYEDLICYCIGMTDRERQRVTAYLKAKLDDHTLFTDSLQQARAEGRDDDYIRSRRRAYNADVYRAMIRILGDNKTRKLKQLALQLNLKKFLIGDEGLQDAVGINAAELEEIGPELREGDRLAIELGAGEQLVPIHVQIANGIRAMSPSDQRRLHKLLGDPMCNLYQAVCNELGGDDWSDLRGRGPRNNGGGNGNGSSSGGN